jgi:protein SCO1/2
VASRKEVVRGIILLTVMVFSGVVLGRLVDPTTRPGPASCAAMSSTPLGTLPRFRYADQNGELVTDRDLLGHTVIAETLFTHCSGVCPLLSAGMLRLTRQLPDEALRFVSFSVDAERDSPHVLAAYAAQLKADAHRWVFLATDRVTLPAVADALQLGAPGLGEPGSLAHSDHFALIDSQGRLRGVYDGTSTAALRCLAADADALLAATAR